MHAVIRTGGKQYRVAQDDVIKVEKLAGEAGDIVVLDEVLAVGNEKDQSVGAPLVAGASVAARVLGQNRAGKIIVFKKKRRQGYRRKHGHRQDVTVLRIEEILTGGKKPTVKPGLAAKAKKGKAAPAKDAPAKPAPKKAEAKAPAKTAEAKPAAKKTEAKTPAKKADTKPSAKKGEAKKTAKPTAKKAPATKAETKRSARAKQPSVKAAPVKPAIRKPAGRGKK